MDTSAHSCARHHTPLPSRPPTDDSEKTPGPPTPPSSSGVGSQNLNRGSGVDKSARSSLRHSAPRPNTGIGADFPSVAEKLEHPTTKSGTPRLSVTKFPVINSHRNSVWSRKSDVSGPSKGSTMNCCNISQAANISGPPECNDDMKRRMGKNDSQSSGEVSVNDDNSPQPISLSAAEVATAFLHHLQLERLLGSPTAMAETHPCTSSTKTNAGERKVKRRGGSIDRLQKDRGKC